MLVLVKDLHCVLLTILLVDIWINSHALLVQELRELRVANGASSILVHVLEKVLELMFCKSQIHFLTNNSELFIRDLVVKVPIEMPESFSNSRKFLV